MIGTPLIQTKQFPNTFDRCDPYWSDHFNETPTHIALTVGELATLWGVVEAARVVAMRPWGANRTEHYEPLEAALDALSDQEAKSTD